LTEELTVFTRKPGLLRRRNRAVTLIEAVLYISIALALIVGGLVFFQQASTAARTSAMVRQLSAVIAEARVLIKGVPVGATPVLLTPFLISAGAVPPDMVASAGTLSNPFGGTTEFSSFLSDSDGEVINITLWNIPQRVCTRLLTATSGDGFSFGSGGAGGTTLVSSGYVNGLVRSTGAMGAWGQNFIMNPTQAGWMCKYGSSNYNTQTTEPTSAPLSGNVDVVMQFLVDH
jgi:type II secretory pathway pseudopilin PulG